MVNGIPPVSGFNIFDDNKRIRRESHILRGVRPRLAGKNKPSQLIVSSAENEGDLVSDSFFIAGQSPTSLTTEGENKQSEDVSRHILPVTIKGRNIFKNIPVRREALQDRTKDHERLQSFFDTLDWKKALEADTDEALSDLIKETFPDVEMNPHIKKSLMNWIKTIQTIGLESIVYELRRLMMKCQYQQKRKKSLFKTASSLFLSDKQEDESTTDAQKKRKKKKKKRRSLTK
jgi:hypothetical protein